VLIHPAEPDTKIGFSADRFEPRPYTVTLWFTPQDGRLILTNLNFTSPGGVDGKLMRKLKLADLMSEFRTRLLEMDGKAYAPVDPAAAKREAARLVKEAVRNSSLAALAEESKPARGRRGYPDDHYERIARRYLQLVNDERVTRGVLARIADEEGRPVETVRTWIYQARQRDFLTRRGEVGRAGALPGPRLLAQTEAAPSPMDPETGRR